MKENILVDHYLQAKLARFADMENIDCDYMPALCNCDWKFFPFSSSMREGKNIIALAPDIFHSIEILITTQN